MLLLKLLIVLIAGISGVFGVLFDTRDKATGQVTRAGWITLGIVVLSALVGVSLEITERRSEAKKEESEAKRAARAAERTEVIVKDVRRTLDRFTTLNAKYSFSLNSTEPFMKAYMARIAKVMAENSKAWYLKDTFAFSPATNEAFFFGDSPLVPRDEDGDVVQALESTMLRIDIFQNRVEPDSYRPDKTYNGNIAMIVVDSPSNTTFSPVPRFGVKQGRVTVSGCGQDMRQYKNDGAIKAVSDLGGTQAFLSLLTIPAKNEAGELYFPEFVLESVTLSTNDGREVLIHKKDTVPIEKSDGSVVSMFVFPKEF